jgi:hypothetical protein
VSIEIKGFFGLLILIADLWAIINIFGANRTTGAKVLWTLLILFLPVAGWLIWLFIGPRASKS